MTSYQPGEPPSYTAPQDPWSGAPGVASPPTDPIPQAPRGQFAAGVATPVAPAPTVWSQQTIAYDDSQPPAGGSGRTGVYVLVALLVLVLGGAGGYGAWYLITERICGDGSCTSAQTEQTQPPDTSATPTYPPFQPEAVQVGDCLVNRGTETDTQMVIEPCSTPHALRVLKIDHGEQLKENAQGHLDGATTGKDLCTGVAGWDGSWFGWDSTKDSLDYSFCLDNLDS